MKDLKKMHGIYLRSSMIISLMLVISAFIFIPTIEVNPYTPTVGNDDFIDRGFDPLDKPDRPVPPQPRRPQPPVDDIDSGADSAMTTIRPTDFDYIPSPRDYISIEIVPYYKVEVKPQLISLPKPAYPELPRKAGIEGTTVVKALVDTDGSIAQVQIFKTSGNQLLDEAALTAAKQARFSPAKMRDRYVQVWVSIPVKFTLKG